MPVIEFTRDVGRKWKKGSIVNLPTSTLKAMAESDNVESYSDFSEVLASGARCIPFMKERRKQEQIAGSVLKNTEVAPVKKKRGRPRRTTAK